jgi:hypothetical protein
MGFEESPSLDLYKDGLPPELPDPGRRRKIFWLVIMVLIITGLVLSILKLKENGVLARLAGTGAVSGYVYDDTGEPISAEVFIFRTDVEGICSDLGYFELAGVPAGEQILIISYRNVGREITVNVVEGQTVELGILRFQPDDFLNGWSQ